ncbi:MAG TPA: aminotransferase class V-fold PLP-dependent enzyme [Clostridia bacterium]|nr:aminotransferase class V-fold PLP-dependent enzyme [Clostridia bacterium]
MIYMDNAATSWPKPRIVYDSVINAMTKYGANPGRSGHTMAVEAASILLYTREMLCQLFSVDDPFSMIFTLNTTDSLNLAIKGMVKEGDHVITTTMEHNSVIRPLMHLAHLGVETTFIHGDSQGFINPQDIERAIKKNTRLIVVTHASNVTGTLMPVDKIGEIARDYGICYLIDAAQTAGLASMNLSKIPADLVAMPGHKGLLGPQGTGVLYIKGQIELRQIREGGTGSESKNVYQPEFLPDRYETGTLNTPGIAGLGAGIEYILSEGQNNHISQIRSIETTLIDGLSQIKGVMIYGPKNIKDRMGIISINIRNRDSSEVSNLLNEKYNIATRGGFHCSPLSHRTIGTYEQGVIRLSPGIFTTLDEAEDCIRAIEEISK